MKQGLFGGTFNPVHNGHIKVICHVKKVFCLDKIHVIPSAVPPHKTSVNLASAKDRLEMVKCAIKDVPGLSASDIELKRRGLSFTIDTIYQFIKTSNNRQQFCNSMSLTDRFYFIMGSDAFFDITTWKKNIEIFNLIPVIVMLRAGGKRNLNQIAYFIKDVISKDYRYDELTGSFINPGMGDVNICKVPAIALSSTSIRKRVHQNLSISSMVPPCVEKIIREKGLYL